MSNLCWCSYCKQWLKKELFYSCKSRSTGVTAGCKACSKLRAKEWNLKNQERCAESARRYSSSENGSKKAKAWRANNKELLRKYAADWRKKNKEALAGTGMSSLMYMPMPAWANKVEIKKIYKQAKRLSRETGVQYHVDHIIPLRGKTVCGLHIETNLRIISKEENMRKLNKLIESELSL